MLLKIIYIKFDVDQVCRPYRPGVIRTKAYICCISIIWLLVTPQYATAKDCDHLINLGQMNVTSNVFVRRQLAIHRPWPNSTAVCMTISHATVQTHTFCLYAPNVVGTSLYEVSTAFIDQRPVELVQFVDGSSKHGQGHDPSTAPVPSLVRSNWHIPRFKPVERAGCV
jgi:hypothetical protein